MPEVNFVEVKVNLPEDVTHAENWGSILFQRTGTLWFNEKLAKRAFARDI